MHSFELGRARSSNPFTDTCAILLIFACTYAAVIGPLINFFFYFNQNNVLAEPGVPNRIFWPVTAVISVVLAVRNRSRFGGLVLPPHIICFLAYLVFAGASVLWAFRPEVSFTRFAQQVMVLTSIVLPGMLAVRTADIMRGVFLCFAFGAILNFFFVFQNPPSADGYPGYFLGKNYLGEFSAIVLLLSLHEVLYPGFRRVLGSVVVIIATLLLLWSNSKTAFGLAIISPMLAKLMLMTRKPTRISLAIVLLSIPFCYAVLSSVSGFNIYRLSYVLYGDSTLTGRTIIWDFVDYEIGRRPLLGWGYQSFWLVGPDAPSVVDAPGWIKAMPNAHNGYYDTTLEMGYVGYYLLVTFIIATVHAIGHMADRDTNRAWVILSLALYIIMYNYLESNWMRGFEFLWVVFVVVAVEVGRWCQPFPLINAAYRSRSQWPSRVLPRGPRWRGSP
jgi:exopolysaccharide production protein ExoQ